MHGTVLRLSQLTKLKNRRHQLAFRQQTCRLQIQDPDAIQRSKTGRPRRSRSKIQLRHQSCMYPACTVCTVCTVCNLTTPIRNSNMQSIYCHIFLTILQFEYNELLLEGENRQNSSHRLDLIYHADYIA